MNVAIIPARGGSKRIPRKNIRLFAGKPIIAYSILAAHESGLFDRILVSTDDEEIAAVSRSWGAETPFVRPPDLSDDYTGTNAVAAHALHWLAAHGEPPSIGCCIYATAPFIEVYDLKRGFDLLIQVNKSFAFSVTTFSSAVQRALRVSAKDGVTPLFPEWIDCRSQDLEEIYRDAGQFYWGRADAFRQDLSLYGAHTVPIVLPRYRVQDIDTPEDWSEAELLHAALTEKTAAEAGA